MTEKNGLFYKKTNRLGECGLQKNKLYFPFFLMGTCGDDRGVISWDGKRELLTAPKKMNLLWFKKVADKLKENPFFDWDWESFKNNILMPNEEHIKEVLKINDDKMERLLTDGYVFINNFHNDWDEDEMEESKELIKKGEMGHYPNFANFLKYDKLEY